jgi:hypothetical protein
MLSGEATNTNFIVVGLTWPGLEPTIYHTQGKHASHYTTDAVPFIYYVKNDLTEWSDMSTSRLMSQWASTIKIQLNVLVYYKADIIHLIDIELVIAMI